MDAKEKIAGILTQWIQRKAQRGYCPLPLVHKVLKDGGIATERYFGAPGKPKLKAWMEKELRDEFLVIGPASGEIVVLRNSLAELLVEGTAACPGLRKENWSLLLSKAGELLRNGGVEYTGPLKDWLRADGFQSKCPYLAVSEDRLTLANAVPAQTAVDAALEIKQLYSYFYMPWNTCTEHLKQLLGQDTPPNFKHIIARQFGAALLGKPGLLLDAREDTPPRMALSSGLYTPDGSPVYCVFEHNEVPEGDVRQDWKLTDYCYPGEGPEGGNGAWLKARLSVCKPDGSADPADLAKQLNEVMELRAALRPALERYLRAVDEGKAPDGEIAGQIERYEKAWSALRESWSKAPVLEPMEGKDLNELRDMTDRGLSFTRSLASILDIFDQVAQLTQEIFSQKRVAPPYTAAADREHLREMYASAAEGASLDLLEEMLGHYDDLAAIMACKNLTDDASLRIRRATEHFQEITLNMSVFFLDHAEESEALREKLGEIRGLLSVCQGRQRELFSARKKPAGADPDELLERLLSGGADWRCHWPEYAAAALPGDPLIRALSLNRVGDAEKLLAADGRDGLCDLSELPPEQTYFSASRRLLQTVGTRERAAEAYLLLGVPCDPENCVPALLDLYRQEERAEDFTRLAEKFQAALPLSLENQRFQLSVLCERAPEQAFAYAWEHFALLYDPECLRVLIPLAGRYKPEAETALRDRLAGLEGLPGPDEFSSAVIGMDADAIQEFVDRPELLGAGYSDGEIKRISMEFTGGNYPGGTDSFSTGKRLQLFLGNRDRLAERYLWKALAGGCQAQSECISMLMIFMADAERWEECRRFYDRYEETISAIGGEPGYLCRAIYLLSLIHSFREEAPGQVRKDLVCALHLLISVRPSVKDTLSKYASEPGAADAGFWQDFLEQVLPPIAGHPPLRTVALLDGYLERLMLPDDALTAHGVDPHQAQKARALYRCGEFCRDVDAGGTALRVFQFFGDAWGAAQALARFALRDGGEDSRALQVLWSLAGEDQNARFDLLSKYPLLRADQPQAYAAYLFQNKKYEAFLEQVSGKPGGDPLDRVRRFIAAQALDPERRDALPEELSQLDWVILLGRRMFETLVNSGRSDEAEKLLRENFDAWLAEVPGELLKDLVQTLAAADRDGLRARAAASGQTALAVYCCNVLNAQDPEGLCQSYYESALANISALDSEQEVREKLEALIRLYPQRDGELRERIIPSRVRLLISKGQTAEAAKTVGEQVGSPAVLRQVFDVLADAPDCHGACRAEPLCSALAEASDALDTRQKCLLFFHRLAGDKPARGFSAFLLKMELAALEKGDFPAELLPQAQRLCLGWVNTNTLPANDALLCLVRLTELADRQEEREYALACLSSRLPDPDARKAIPELSGKEAAQFHLVDSLHRVLHERGPEELRCFFDFCRALAGTMAQDNGLDEDAEAVQALFADPSAAASWRECGQLLGLDAASDATGRYLCLAMGYAPALYEDYAAYCLKKPQYASVLPTLLSWARTGYVSQCLSFVNNSLESEPGLFRSLTEDPSASEAERGKRADQTEELVDVFCKAFSGEDGRLTAERLGNLIHVTVKAGSGRALERFLETFSEALFAWSGEEVALALICRLLLDGRVDEAAPLLRTLAGYLMENSMPLEKTLCKLADKDALEGTDALAKWLENPGHRLLLNLVLPNGKRYNMTSINALILRKTPAELRLDLSRELSEVGDLQKDYGLCAARFILASSAPNTAGSAEERCEILYESLCAMVSNPPDERSRYYYRRDRAENARALAVLTAAMRDAGKEEEVRSLCGTVFGADYDGIAVQDQVRRLLSLKDQFTGREDRFREILFHFYLSLVTGNWYDALYRGWSEEQSLSGLPRPTDLLKGGSASEKLYPPVFGLFRSALKVLCPLDKADRESFLAWMGREENVAAGFYSPAAVELLTLFSNRYLDELARALGKQELDRLLDYPVEFPTFGQLILSAVYAPMVKRFPELLFTLTLLLGACGDSDNLVTELEKRALEAACRQNKDSLLSAGQMYHALELLCPLGRKHIFYSKDEKERKKLPPKFYPAFYHARHLLCGALGGDRDVLALLRGGEMSLAERINLFFELSNILWDNRSQLTAADCEGLLNALDAKGLRLLKTLLMFTDKDVPDGEKTERLKSFHSGAGDRMWGMMCYILKYPYAGKVEPRNLYCLQAKEVAHKLNEAYEAEPDLGPDFNGRQLKTYLLLADLRSTNPNAGWHNPEWDILRKAVLAMEDRDEALTQEQAPEAEEVDLTSVLEALAPLIEDAGLPPLTGDGDPALLAEGGALDAYFKKWGALNGRPNRSLMTLDQRLEDAGQLFRAALSGGGTPESRYICALLYCVNLYDCLRKEKKDASRVQAFKQLMSLPAAALRDRDCSPLVLSVVMGGEAERLFSAPQSIDALLDDRREHGAVYQNIAQILNRFPEHRPEGAYFTGLYQVLDGLESDLETAGTDATRTTCLRAAYGALPAYDSKPMLCKTVYNKVRGLIDERIQELDNRPALTIKVLNPDFKCYPRKDVLSGTVTNNGKCPAMDIRLQLSIGGKSQGQCYTLPRLAAFGGVASFEIPYVLEGEGDELYWALDASFADDKGEDYNDSHATGTLHLLPPGQEPAKPKRCVKYNDKTIFFEDPAQGETPQNDDFVGREKEKELLEGLVESKSFIDCGNAIVYGIRRVGKTSLLNYFMAYVRANRPDIFLVDFNCKNVSSGGPVIWKTFVEPCLDKVSVKVLEQTVEKVKRPGEAEIDEDAWKEFRKNWTPPAGQTDPDPASLVKWTGEAGQTDLDPTRLPSFFEQLSAITKKGCYLVLDEVDTLFKQLNQRGGIDSLLTVLQGCNTTDSTAGAFHYILCGSTWILRNITDGENTRQILHGTTPIEVGRLPKDEIKKLLHGVKWELSGDASTGLQAIAPFITPGAVDAVWNFTGGLVWYTKLVGNAMLQRVYDSGRTVVYPYDVHVLLDSQINTDNFDILLDGVKDFNQVEDSADATGEAAFNILMDLQAKAVDQSVYVSEEDLREMSDQGKPEQSESFNKAMDLLERLKLIESKNGRYRFCVDIYRRYFRKYSIDQKGSRDADAQKKAEGKLYFCREAEEERTTVSESDYGDLDDI